MITIELHNGYCKLKTLERTVHTFLDSKFSAWEEGAYFSTAYKRKIWDGKYHAYNKMNGIFKPGLLKSVTQLLTKHGYPWSVEDERLISVMQDPICDRLMYVEDEAFRELRDYQIAAVDTMMQECIGVIKAATNAGKTEMFCELVRRLNMTTTLICTRKELFHQTADRLRRRLGVPIGQVGDGLLQIEHITVVMPGSAARKVSVPGRKNKVMRMNPECECLLKSDILLLDECHNFGDSRIEYIVDHSEAYYRFALSGTPMMKDKASNLKLRSQFGDIIFEISNQELIAKGVSSVPYCYFIKEDAPDISDLPYDMAYMAGVSCNQSRNQKAATLANMLVEKYNKTVLMICAQIEHCNNLNMELPDATVVHGECTSAHRMETLENLKNGTLKKVIATTIYDEGIDTDKIDCIIMMAGMKTPERVLQRVGRGIRRRESMVFWYFDFLDVGNPYLLDHSTERINSLRKEGFDVKLMNSDI